MEAGLHGLLRPLYGAHHDRHPHLHRDPLGLHTALPRPGRGTYTLDMHPCILYCISYIVIKVTILLLRTQIEAHRPELKSKFLAYKDLKKQLKAIVAKLISKFEHIDNY